MGPSRVKRMSSLPPARPPFAMLASIRSAAVVGIDAREVIVEADVARGMPNWTIVGLASGAVRESRERVVAAILNSGYELPARRVTIALAPAGQESLHAG